MNETFCPNCKEEVSQIEFECSHCKFPLNGTEKEKSIFIGRQIANKSKIGNAKDNQKKVGRILYVVGGFQLLNAFISYNNNYYIENTIFYIILGLLLVVFGFFSTKKPILFISLALGLILSYYLLIYLNSPEYFLRGILWKVIIVGFLIYGVIQSLEERKLKKENKFLK